MRRPSALADSGSGRETTLARQRRAAGADRRSSDWATRHLRIANASYDETIRRFIPGYGEMLDRAASLVVGVRPALVVDLGSGTGSLAEAVLIRDDRCVVELVDSDESMLSQARKRLASFGDRTAFRCAPFSEPLGLSDAVCASLALHHVPRLEEKRKLYRTIFGSVREGGVFVNADAALSSDPSETKRIYAFWADHMATSGIDRERAFRHFEEWSEEDTYFTLDEELQAVTDAGFEAECAWRLGAATIVVGRK